MENNLGLFTSYFSKVMKHQRVRSGELEPVSIATSQPNGFNLHTDLSLAPRLDMVYGFKNGSLSEINYRFLYRKLLDERISFDLLKSCYKNTVLVCWEAPDKFCHRFVFAEWFYEKFGSEIKELQFEDSFQEKLPF